MSDPRQLAIQEHRRWLGYLQPDGLVFSAVALVDSQIQINQSAYAEAQSALVSVLANDTEGGDALPHFTSFATGFLGWDSTRLLYWAVADECPVALQTSVSEGGEILRPDGAYQFRDSSQAPDPSRPYHLLIRQLPEGTDPDAVQESAHGWSASPMQKFERLLRQNKIAVGLLSTPTALRLVYAPVGENTGSLTFPLECILSNAGRPAAEALRTVLGRHRLEIAPKEQRLLPVLQRSRAYQNSVSTELAKQVLSALYELVRGFQAADEAAHGTVLREVRERDPDEVYHGLLTLLLRLVVLLFAEDRGLMPSSPLYARHYGAHGLFEQLRADHERHSATMDRRYGAYARLIALFRLLHDGCGHPQLRVPARRGHLFDPDRFPFLEGRAGSPSQQLPLVPDGTLHGVLRKLLFLDGERLSYRDLDVEQIGSVYETIMGFRLELATERTVALKPGSSKGASVFVPLEQLLAQPGANRARFLKDTFEIKLPTAANNRIKAAQTLEDLVAGFGNRIDRDASPDVLPAGSLLLQPTDERRRSGSHYTPASFTQPIVEKTLAPVLDRLGRHPRPEVILDLKVCDPAVGSAAFLVETCRQLAHELVASWHYHRCLPPIPPDEDEVLHARRLVAQRCLYGVDRNPMAADLAKLSLWLLTMAREHPFTFVDHAIRSGDSLVGISNNQIAACHWNPAGNTSPLASQAVRNAVERAGTLRRQILEAGDALAPEDKARRLAEAEAAQNQARLAGDVVVAAFFAADNDRRRESTLGEFVSLLGEAGKPEEKVRGLREQGPHPVQPFHWELEFPEVFARDNPGFDAFVGNPPYAYKNTIIKGNRPGYIEWLKALHAGSHGNSDLVAHFFRRTFSLLRSSGTFGLIATNTIAQGDTRQSGLRWICTNGGTIYAASRRTKWPGEAAVVVSVVWVVRGVFNGERRLDERPVSQITAFLFHDGGHDNPKTLTANAGKSFQGSIVLGMGFTFDDTTPDSAATPISEMHRLIAKDPRNAERIFPYIGGEEVNTSPTHAHHRYVINFADYPLERRELGVRWIGASEAQQKEWLRDGIVPLDYPSPVAADWPDLLEIVRAKVKPERDRQNDKIGRTRWWNFLRTRPEMMAAIAPLERVLVCSRHQPNWCIGSVDSRSVFSEALVIFALEHAGLALLQSSVHEEWARFFASSMKDDLRYTPTDCFETFPFPLEWEADAELERVGREYYEYRAALMVERGEGLTKTYNRFHAPEETEPGTLRLRELHGAMDAAVLRAYGWGDLVDAGRTACEFVPDYYEEPEDGGDPVPKSVRYRWSDATRDEVLARLLALNAERAAQEAAAAPAPTSPSPRTRRSRPAQPNPPPQGDLFG
ncbi:MAG: hypothetical protein RLZZ244_2154 [Verrucomicrobiota bacterium]